MTYALLAEGRDEKGMRELDRMLNEPLTPTASNGRQRVADVVPLRADLAAQNELQALWAMPQER